MEVTRSHSIMEFRNHKGVRKVSPGCLAAATASAPAPRAKYRESNASRLRQEKKGMTVTGMIVGHGLQSKSPSPTKSYPQSSTPKHNSGSSTPKNRIRSEMSPDKSLDILSARLQNSSNAAAKNRGRLEVSPDKSLDVIATPRSMSETSNASRETQDRMRSLMANATTGYVVDTRSKTINTVIRHPASEDSLSNAGRKSASNNVPSIGPGVGYGKPLVTNLSKKLTVMKDVPKSLSEVKDSKSAARRGKSPARPWRTDNKDSVSSVPGKKFDRIKSKSPVKGATANKLHTSNTVPKIKPDEKVAIMCSVAGKQMKGSLTSVNKRNSKSPTKPDKTEDILISRARSIRSPLQKEIKSWSPESNRSPNRLQNKDRPSSLNKMLQESSKSIKKEQTGLQTSPNPKSFPKAPNTEKKIERSRLEPLQDMLSKKLKQSFCKDGPTSGMGRPASGMYSRSFKPQLEDIKSSFILMNKQNQDQNNKGNMDKENKKELLPVHRPKPFSEEFRKQLLIEARMKFQSKHFWNDSKYDKIEGLNWISWK